MSFDPHLNLRRSTVSIPPTPPLSGTTLVVADGSVFPSTSLGAYNLLVWPNGEAPTTDNCEIVRCTVRSSDSLTITRTQESSTARSILVGDQVALGPTAKTFTDIEGTVTGLQAAPPSHGASLHTDRLRYIPLVPVTGVTWATDAHGALNPFNLTAHFEKVDGANAPVTFLPVITPSDFASNMKIVCIISSSVGGGNLFNSLYLDEELQTADAASAAIVNGSVAMAVHANANTTSRGESASFTPTVGSVLRPYMAFDRANAGDTNTGTVSVWACFLEYTADS